MAITTDDVRKIAALARLDLDEARIPALAAELSGILAHMEALNAVDTTDVPPTAGGGGNQDGMRRRNDVASPIPMRRAGSALAAESRDGFILVPRLSTHEDA